MKYPPSRKLDLCDILLYAVICVGMGFALFVLGVATAGGPGWYAWTLASLPTVMIVLLLWMNGWRT